MDDQTSSPSNYKLKIILITKNRLNDIFNNKTTALEEKVHHSPTMHAILRELHIINQFPTIKLILWYYFHIKHCTF